MHYLAATKPRMVSNAAKMRPQFWGEEPHSTSLWCPGPFLIVPEGAWNGYRLLRGQGQGASSAGHRITFQQGTTRASPPTLLPTHPQSQQQWNWLRWAQTLQRNRGKARVLLHGLLFFPYPPSFLLPPPLLLPLLLTPSSRSSRRCRLFFDSSRSLRPKRNSLSDSFSYLK